MNREIKNNQVTLSGKIVSNLEFSHEVCGEGFYTFMLAVERLSLQNDFIPITVSNRLVDTGEEWAGRFVKVSGQFRSYNKHEMDKHRLVLSVFATGFEEVELSDDDTISNNYINKISLDGYVCKQPAYRETPLGREITDILLAVNRPYRKSDYIPVICWGRNARFAGSLEVGTRLQIEGRIQSREYQKRISDDEYETRTAYEVSVNRMEVVTDEQRES